MIALNDVWRIYQVGDAPVVALQGVNLRIGDGEFLAIVGPSGSGKSTLLQIIGLLDRPSRGTVELDGRDLGGLSDGRVNWSFVQSASLAPSITLPPWGADLAAPEVRGGSFTWNFGAVRSGSELEQVLHAYAQNSLTGHGQFWGPTQAGLEYQLFILGGPWAPHATENPGGG